MSTYAEFDRSQLPLIVIRFTGAKATPENFAEYLAELDRNYAPRKPFALVFELSKAPVPSLKYQRQQADWMKENQEVISQYCVGVAYVIPGTIMRGVLKSIFSFQKQPAPYKVVATITEGEEWANAQLEMLA
ncbi:MAG: STAS/SEC14 domain-containing protein [Bacteroidota bacterium]